MNWDDPPKGWSGGSTRAWRRVRDFVLRRDGHVCQLRIMCEGAPATHVDHKISKRNWPRGRAGCDDPANLQASCEPCNLAKGSGGAVVLRDWAW